MHFPLPRRVMLLGAALTVVVALACTDLATTPVRDAVFAPDGSPARTASFACGVTYTSITYNSDSEMAPYGVPARTDTSSICETWTGTDYMAQVDRIGSSEPASETSDEIKTVVYRDGQSTAYLANGVQVADAQSVGATAFDFGQATAAEQQASYNDPYYGVAQSSQPGGCPNDPTAIICNSASRIPSSGGASLNVVPDPAKRDHGFKRRALRALLNGSDEIAASPNGGRRFRSVKGDEESIIEVETATELMREQETISPTSRTKAKLSWALRGNRYIRERMEIDGEEVRGGKRFGSKVVVLLQDVRFDPSVRP